MGGIWLMWEVFIYVYIFLFAINGMLIYFDSVSELPITTPIDGTEVIPTSQPYIYNGTNGTGTFIDEVTNPINQTDSSPWDFLEDNLFFGLQMIKSTVDLFTAGFVWQAVALFGLPAGFTEVMQGIIGIFLFLTILHFWTGRF